MTTLSDMPALEPVCGNCDCETICSSKTGRGRGILPGDFIKPDPALTQRETRTYILEELQRWLTGRICEDAKDVGGDFSADDLVPYLEAGTWPAGRLYSVLQLLEKDASYILPPADEMDHFHFVGQWAVSVCSDYLSGYEPGIPAAVLATGFVTDDRLPCGRTIESFWNHSPFKRLREAPPLESAPAPAPADEPADEPEDEETESAPAVKSSIDDQLDAVTSVTCKVLSSIPVWILAAAVGAYLGIALAGGVAVAANALGW
jgi:hypothetical protein